MSEKQCYHKWHNPNDNEKDVRCSLCDISINEEYNYVQASKHHASCRHMYCKGCDEKKEPKRLPRIRSGELCQ